MRALACVCLVLSLSACDKFNEGFDSAFKVGFKKSFVEACVKSARTNANQSAEQLDKLCTCAADGLMKDTSVSDLQDMDKVSSRSGPIIQQCVKQNLGTADAKP